METSYNIYDNAAGGKRIFYGSKSDLLKKSPKWPEKVNPGDIVIFNGDKREVYSVSTDTNLNVTNFALI